jgi:hypothetical protein
MKISGNNICAARLIFLTVSLIFLSVTFVYAIDTCTDCHKNEKYRIQNRVLFEYYNNWKDSLHEIAEVRCSDCHGGDATKSDKDSSHKNHFSSLSSLDKGSFKLIPLKCGKCHEGVLDNFIRSKHYKALLDKETGPVCSTCHGSMNVEVYYTSIVARVCIICHNEYTRNRPEIVGESDKILHRINVTRAFKNWVSIYYSKKEPAKVREVTALYKDIADSWHQFDFKELDEKSLALLNKLKSLVNRGLEEKRKKMTEK